MFGLAEKDIHQICNIFANYPQIEKVLIYGSRAKGNFRPGSDIDLTIEGTLNFNQLMVLENELEELLLPYKIDLSLLSTIKNPDLLDHIARVGKVFYENPARLKQDPIQKY